ncbi:MAG: hypothetical protein R3B48_27485 [Kofleriaceae bacterium]
MWKIGNALPKGLLIHSFGGINAGGQKLSDPLANEIGALNRGGVGTPGNLQKFCKGDGLNHMSAAFWWREPVPLTADDQSWDINVGEQIVCAVLASRTQHGQEEPDVHARHPFQIGHKISGLNEILANLEARRELVREPSRQHPTAELVDEGWQTRGDPLNLGEELLQQIRVPERPQRMRRDAAHQDQASDPISMTAVRLEGDLYAHRVTKDDSATNLGVVENSRKVVCEVDDPNPAQVCRRRRSAMATVVRMYGEALREVLAQIPPNVTVATDAVAERECGPMISRTPRLVKQGRAIKADSIRPRNIRRLSHLDFPAGSQRHR